MYMTNLFIELRINCDKMSRVNKFKSICEAK